jgi:hypothetical protein
MHEPHGPIVLADPVDRSHPLNRGRVLWLLTLPGLDGGRRWFDLLGLCHGTLEDVGAAAGWRGTTRPGGWGHLEFDGTANQDVSASLPGLVATSLTVAAWANPRVDNANLGQQNLVSAVNFHVTVRVGSRPGIVTPGGAWLESAIDTPAGRWSRVAFVVGPSLRQVWVDGQLGGSDALGGATISPTTGLLIGRRPDVTTGYDGALDDVAIWARALPAAEVRADHDLSRRGYPGVLRRLGSRAWRSAPAGPGPLAASYYQRRRRGA